MRSPLVLLLLLAGALPLAADGPKSLEQYKKLVTPALRKTLDEQFAFLNRWPEAVAKKAAEQIVSIGDAAVPDLIRELEGGHWRAQVASAEICGQLRAPITFDAVAGSARQPAVRSHLDVYFHALARIDRRRAVGTLTGFLASRYTEVRGLAMRYASGLVKPADLPLVLALSRTKRRDSRAAALTLLGRIGGDAARGRLLEGLADEEPPVADAASEALAAEADPARRAASIAVLQQKLSSIDRRHRAYLGLTLVRLEDAHGGRLFPVASHGVFLQMLAHPEQFISGAAAVALANFGRYAGDPRIVQALDQQVVPRLIETLATTRYFKEIESLRPLALHKLRELSSEDFGKDYRGWSRWWLKNKDRFQAIRRLEQVPVARIDELRVTLRRIVPGRSDDRWLFACRFAPEFEKRYPEGLVFVLDLTQMERLVAGLRGAGFFARQTERLQVVEGRALWDVELALGRRGRRLACSETLAPDVGRVVALLEAAAEPEEWQRYWDQRFWPDREKWWRYHRSWWSAADRSLVDRVRKLKSMIVTSFGGLAPRRRAAAARRLAGLLDEDPQLSRTQAEIGVALLKALGGFGQTERDLAHALAKSRQPSIVTELVRFLIAQPAKQAQPILETLFGHMGQSVALAFLGNTDPRLRAAACAAMWRYGGEQIDLALVKALRDKHALVRQGAVHSLGKLRKRLAVPTLEELLSRETDDNLRRSIYTALGRIGGDAAFARLSGELKQAAPELVPVLLAALGQTRDERAIDPLLAAYFQPEPGNLREVAAAGLFALPRAAVERRLLGVAGDRAADLSRRAAALDLLGRRWSRPVGQALAPLLADLRVELARQAARILAGHREPRAVPVLIEALAAAPADAATREALEALTMTAFDGPAEGLAGKYRAWWKSHARLAWRVWLLEALEREVYATRALAGWCREGQPAGAGVGTLIDALIDRRWYIGHGASLALNEIFDLPRPPLPRHASRERRLATAALWRGVWNERRK